MSLYLEQKLGITKHMVNFKFLFILIFSLPSLVFAENSTVTKTNYTAGGGYEDFNGSFYALHGTVATPLGKYWGAALSTGYFMSDMEENFADSKGRYFGGKIFIGDATKGRAGISYINLKSKYESNLDDFEIHSDRYSIDLEWYIGNVSLGAERIFIENDINNSSVIIEGADDSNNFIANMDYYHNENSKISLSIGSMDIKDVHIVSVEVLPKSLTQRVSVGLSYADMPNDRSISFGFKYYFTDSASLKDRDRHY